MNPFLIRAPYRVSILTRSSIVDGLSCKKLTESLFYMTIKFAHVIEKRLLYSQNMCGYFFYDFGVYPIAENFLFSLQLFKVIWIIAVNQGETFTQPFA